MKHSKARVEVLKALAEFDQACADFSRRMGSALAPEDPVLGNIVQELGAPRPAKRAEARATVTAPGRQRQQ